MGLFGKNQNEQPLTRKRLEKHIILTIVSCLVISLVGGVVPTVSFYYKTNNDLENLKSNDERHDAALVDFKKHLNEISSKIGDTRTSNAVSDEKIKSLESKLLNLQEQQDLILKTQFDILKLIGDKK